VWLRGVNQMETIPHEVLALLQRREATFGLSAISLWEIGKKVQIGKLKLPKALASTWTTPIPPRLATATTRTSATTAAASSDSGLSWPQVSERRAVFANDHNLEGSVR
jgi:PIN domain nuclease of toxin-antitoxin system